MYKYTVLSYYGIIIIAIVVTIWYLWRVLKKKKLISLTVQNSTEYKINIVLKIILGIILIAIHLKGTIPAIRDIPYVLDNNLNKIEGVAISSDKKKNDADWHLRSFSYTGVREENRKVEFGYYHNAGVNRKVKLIFHREMK